MTATIRASGQFSAVKADDMFEQRRTNSFLKKIALAMVEARYRRSFAQKLAEFAESGTKWASQPIGRSVSEEPSLQPLTDHEVLKVIRATNFKTRLMLRYMSLAAVLKFLLQYSTTFEMSYDSSFNEARASDISKELVSWGFLQGAVETTCSCYVDLRNLLRRYPKAVLLVKKVNENADPSSSAAGTGGLGVKNLDSVLLSQSDLQEALLLTKTVAVSIKEDIK